jgi:autotransporter adhesin
MKMMNFRMKSIALIVGAICIAPHVTAQVAGGTGTGGGTDICQQSGASMACGANSLASNNQSVAIGGLTRAADGGTSVGVNAGAGLSATAIGNSATASGGESIAIGLEPAAFGSQSIAIGAGAMATGSGDITMGASTVATGGSGTALGTGASVTGAGSVALGAGSTDAGRTGVVSVGSSSATRQITNVSAGTQITDAVNVSQLREVETTANNALTTASTANNTASNALTTATTANSTANTANNTASDALTTATTANSTANTANNTANNALTTATTANSTANTANNTANNALGRVNDLESKAVTYTSSTSTNVVLRSGADGAGTLISNVGSGQSSHDAVNLAQLQQTQADIMAAVDSLVKSGACSYVNGRLACGGATATGNNSVSMGTNAQSSGASAVAMGPNSKASGENSVAIGAGSLAVRANSVSVGNEQTGMTRTITGVAPGVMDTDAVNVSQLKSATAGLLLQANKYAAQAAARAMSIPTPHISEGRSHAFAVAVGGYDGYGALGATYAYKVDDDASVQLGVATGGSGFAGRAAVNFSW